MLLTIYFKLPIVKLKKRIIFCNKNENNLQKNAALTGNSRHKQVDWLLHNGRFPIPHCLIVTHLSIRTTGVISNAGLFLIYASCRLI